MGKNSSEGKRVQHPFGDNLPVKNLTRKTQRDKTMVKGKECRTHLCLPLIKTIVYETKKVK